MSMGKDYRGPVVDYDSIGVIADLYFGMLRAKGVSSRNAREQTESVRSMMEGLPATLRGVAAISDVCRTVGLDPQELGIAPHINGDWCPDEWRRL